VPEPTVEAADSMAYAAIADLPILRLFVAERAIALGLPPDRAELLKLAVSELATNTLQYTVGGGRVRVLVEADQLVVEVVDRGPAPELRRGMPAADAERGRGLPIVVRVCDDVSTTGTAEGTVIRLRFNL
jgi:anti-sigma regulatory factor (Ser/Thr protein kinase)